MVISFEVDGRAARFRRSDAFGGVYLDVAGETITLESAWSPKAHSSFTTKRWSRQIGDHLIEVVQVKERWWLGAQRPSFTVLIDGKVIATREGDSPH